MSGSNSSPPGSSVAPDEHLAGVSFTVHSMPQPDVSERRTVIGRAKMLLVLLVCAAPVVASYFTYFVIRPEGRTNYSELISPPREVPAALPFLNLQGEAVHASTLHGQWLLVVVAGGACDAECDKKLWVQRQLRETLGREKDRLDKLWLIPDDGMPAAKALQALAEGPPVTVLRVPRESLAAWLEPASGHRLEDHLYVVDPMGNWMMRAPAALEPLKLKRDIEKLLRASSSWDQPGR